MLNGPGFYDTALDTLTPDVWFITDNTNYGGNIWIDRGKANKNLLGRFTGIVQSAGRGWTLSTWKNGKGAITLNGTTDYISIGATRLNITPTTPFSASCWAKSTGINNSITFGNRDSSSNGWILGVRQSSVGGAQQVYMQDASGHAFFVFSNANISNDNKWHHLLFTYDGSNSANGINLYTDGSAVTNNVNTNVSLTSLVDTSFTIGAQAGGSIGWTGYIDDVRIYLRNLNATDVMNIYQRSLLGKPGPSGIWNKLKNLVQQFILLNMIWK